MSDDSGEPAGRAAPKPKRNLDPNLDFNLKCHDPKTPIREVCEGVVVSDKVDEKHKGAERNTKPDPDKATAPNPAVGAPRPKNGGTGGRKEQSRGERFKRELQRSYIFRPPREKQPPPTLDEPDPRGSMNWFGLLPIAGYLLVAVALICAISAAQLIIDPNAAEQPLDIERAALEGRVETDRGEPLDGASVRLHYQRSDENHTTGTNESGWYRFTGVAAGNAKLTVNATGYVTKTHNITLTPTYLGSQPNREDLTLNAGTGSVEKGTYSNATKDRVRELMGFCSAILIVVCVLVGVAALMVFKRTHFPVALFGALSGIFAATFFFIPSILSATAAFIIILRRRAFMFIADRIGTKNEESR